jgi:hypothetical protein
MFTAAFINYSNLDIPPISGSSFFSGGGESGTLISPTFENVVSLP